MSKILYVEVNAVASLVLFLIYISTSVRRHGKGLSFDQTIFDYLLLANIGILVTDAGILLCNNINTSAAFILNSFFSSVYYALQPAFCCLWLFYSDFKLKNDFERIKRRALWYSLPALGSAVLSGLSIFNGWLFRIDSANVYHRGSMFFIEPGLCFFYTAIVVILTALEYRADRTPERLSLYRTMLFFPLITVAATIIQIMFYGLSLIWVASALSILAVYLNLQNKEVYIDALTGLYNRRYIEAYLLGETSNVRSGSFLGLLMIDIDDCKQYNDRFGHTEGDALLRVLADMLRGSLGKNDFVARYGGDEFIVVLQRESIGEIDRVVDNIHAKFSAYIESNEKARSFRLTISIGRSLFGEHGSRDLDSFVRLADTRMYEEKLLNRERKAAEPAEDSESAVQM